MADHVLLEGPQVSALGGDGLTVVFAPDSFKGSLSSDCPIEVGIIDPPYARNSDEP